MGLRNTSNEFGSMAKWLHWLIAIGLVVIFYMGLEQAGMERGPEKSEMRVIHGSIALLVFVLMTVRLIWRFMNEVPGHPDGMPALQRAAATLVHWAIYIAVFAQLVSGPITIATGGTRNSFLRSVFFFIAGRRERRGAPLLGGSSRVFLEDRRGACRAARPGCALQSLRREE